MKVLFVCLGNICRSPAVEGLAKQMYPEWEIDSAGRGSWHIGDSADVRSVSVCESHGIDISGHKARRIRIGDDDYFDWIVGIDRQNILDLKNILPKSCHHKILMLDDTSVQDPYFGGEEGFEEMYQHLYSALKNLPNRFLNTVL